MSTFTTLNIKKVGVFGFREPRTEEDLKKEIEENRKRFGVGKNQYKITDDEIENNLIKTKVENKIKEEKTIIKEQQKDNDFKQAKKEKDFISEIEKGLEEFTVKNGEYFEITNRIPTKILIKQLLKLTTDINEKKKIVNEESNLKIDEAKKNKGIVEIKLNNKIYKIKFIGE